MVADSWVNQWIHAPHGIFPLHRITESHAFHIWEWLLFHVQEEVQLVDFYDDQTEGMCDLDQRVIYISKSLSTRARCLVIIHEWGHLLMHRNLTFLTEAVAEFQAELFTWIIACDLQIEQDFTHAHYCMHYLSALSNVDRLMDRVWVAVANARSALEVTNVAA